VGDFDPATGGGFSSGHRGMALNELRWYENAPLKLKIGAKPAVLASQGNVGVIETTDYRGVKVLASYTYLPETQWGFVAKTRMFQKFMPPIKKMMINIAIILLIFHSVCLCAGAPAGRKFFKTIIEFPPM